MQIIYSAGTHTSATRPYKDMPLDCVVVTKPTTNVVVALGEKYLSQNNEELGTISTYCTRTPQHGRGLLKPAKLEKLNIAAHCNFPLSNGLFAVCVTN